MSRSNSVFVVDGDPSPRDGLLRLLNAAGYVARGFESADEMLRHLDLEAEVLGCLVLDLRMRGLSAWDLQRELEARGLNAPVIVVTADDTPETRRMAQNMKATAFFRKPVDSTALLDSIEWTLSKKVGSVKTNVTQVHHED